MRSWWVGDGALQQGAVAVPMARRLIEHESAADRGRPEGRPLGTSTAAAERAVAARVARAGHDDQHEYLHPQVPEGTQIATSWPR